MGYRGWYKDPEDMTPEERIQRIIELMAIASIRFATEHGAEEIKKDAEIPIDSGLTAMDPRDRKKKGPLPFGYMWTKYGIVVNEAETALINQIKELAKLRLSSEKIAKHLNKVDKESRRAGKWSRTAVWRILRRAR